MKAFSFFGVSKFMFKAAFHLWGPFPERCGLLSVSQTQGRMGHFGLSLKSKDDFDPFFLINLQTAIYTYSTDLILLLEM